MSYDSSTGIITKPVSIYDLQQALSSSSSDLGTLCMSSNINKWAKYKPVVVANNVGRLTYTELSNANFGLSYTQNTLLASRSDRSQDSSTVSDIDELEEIFVANTQWNYTQPSGGISSPFRLTDFYAAQQDSEDAWGYYKDTPGPIDNVSNMTIKLSDLRTCMNNGDITSSGSAGAWILEDDAPILYTNLKFRYGSETGYNMNGADVRSIILTDLMGMTSSDNYRLAVAVQVPSGSSLSYMRFFASKRTFAQFRSLSTKTPAEIMPCLGSNQFLCYLINNYMSYLYYSATGDKLGNHKLNSTDPTATLPACLCVVKDIKMGREQGTYTHCQLDSTSYVYPAPAVITKFSISIVDDVNFSSGGGAYDIVNIGTRMTGKYTQFGEATYTRAYIYEIILEQKESVSTSVMFKYTINYTYVTGYGSSGFITATGTISDSIELNSSELKKITLYAAPGLSITSKKQEIS